MRNKNWDKRELNQLYNVEGKTLQEIGDMRGVSRERVRQVMEKFGLTRGSNRSEKARMTNWHRYKTLEAYLENPGERQDIATHTLRRLIKGLRCSECGKVRNINIHHIVYPATQVSDIQILCASCHHAKHRKGITYLKQIDIYNQYKRGKAVRVLAEKYKVSECLIYKILSKIRNGNSSLRESYPSGRLSRHTTKG